MKNIMLILTLVSLAGCGTILSKRPREGKADGWGTPYSGVRCTSELVRVSATTYKPLLLLLPFEVVDIVLSAAVDTVLLPADLIMDRKKYTNYCNIGSISP